MNFIIGFKHLRASILGEGLLDGRTTECPNYKKEKEQIRKVINAYSDMEILPHRTHDFAIDLIKNYEKKYWSDSRYNVLIDNVRSEIMKTLAFEIGKKIVRHTTDYIVAEDLSKSEYDYIKQSIVNKYKGLIMYYIREDSKHPSHM